MWPGPNFASFVSFLIFDGRYSNLKRSIILKVYKETSTHVQLGVIEVLVNWSSIIVVAGWEVLIVKTCYRGLENAAQSCRPRAALPIPRSQFFTKRTDIKQVTYYSLSP